MSKEIRHHLYPKPEGLIQAARVMCRPVKAEEAMHTDKLGLVGICLVFPEFKTIVDEIETLIVLGHQIDHLMDEGGENCSRKEILRNFNVLYPRHLRPNYQNPRLVQNTLGFLSQSLIVEKEIRLLSLEGVDEKQIISYRELINAIWVRMIISFGFGLLTEELDEVGFLTPPYKYSDLESAHHDYIQGLNLSTVPGKKRNYLLFLWTMAIQDIYDQSSIRNNSSHEIPALQNNQPQYGQKAINSGLHPIAFKAAIISVRAMTQLMQVIKRN